MRLDSGFKPEQLIVNGANTGAYELLNLQMSLFEKISGVSAAMQGQNLSGVNGSKLYDSQVENSTISLLDSSATCVSVSTRIHSFLSISGKKVSASANSASISVRYSLSAIGSARR